MLTKTRMFSLFATLAVGFLISGCAQRIGAFTISSTKNVKVNAEQLGARVEGKHAVFFGTASLEQAVDDAIEKAPGADALIDVVIWRTYSWLGLRQGFKVKGTPVSTDAYALLREAKTLVTSKNVEDWNEIAQFIEAE